MPEEKIAQDMLNAWLAMELVGCGYPIKCPEDVKGLQFAVAQTEVSVVTRDKAKIIALINAITVFIEKFINHLGNEIIEAALVLALALQVSAKDTLNEMRGESHLEVTP